MTMATSTKAKVCLICLHRFSSRDNPGNGLKNAPEIKQEVVDNETTSGPSGFEAVWKGDDGNSGGDLYQRFLKFVGRYFKLRQTTDFLLEDASRVKDVNGKAVTLQVFCEGCRILVQETCDLFHELEKVKLLLLGKVGQVGHRMKILGHQVSNRDGRGLLVELREQLNARTTKQVEIFRRMLRLKCVNAGNSSLPRVPVYKGLFPDQWKFTYSATKQALTRLIVVFMLTSVKPPGLGQIKTPEVVPVTDFGNDSDSDWECDDNLHSPGTPASSSVTSEPEEENSNITKTGKSRQSQNAKEPVDQNAKRKLKCPQCSNRFANSGALTRHLRTIHRSNLEYPCKLCGMRFALKKDCIKHHNELHGKYVPFPYHVPVQCPDCLKNFVNRSSMNKHQRRNPNCSKDSKPRDTVHECPICFRTIRTELRFTQHLQRHENGKLRFPEGVFYCEVCGKHFVKRDTLNAHMKQVHGNNYPCSTCDANFNTPKPLWDHLLSQHETEKQNFHCLLCCRGFSNEQYFNIHKSVMHRDKRRIFCSEDTCHESFQTNLELNDHLKTHAGNIMICKTCEMGFLEERKLKQHKLWHTPRCESGEGYDCPVCQKNFTSREGLVLHFNAHHNDAHKQWKNLQCAVCQKKFRDHNYLKKHMAKHKPQKRKEFICNICGKTMENLSGLRKHKKQEHTSNKQNNDRFKIKCEVDNCQKIVFTKRISEHVDMEHENKVDENQKNLQCFYCYRRFYHERSRKLHMRFGHKSTWEEKLRCDAEQCEELEGFDNLELLNEHLQSCHEQERIFKCEKCTWGFVRKEVYDIHQLGHQFPRENGRFTCPDCSFISTKIKLVQHHFTRAHGTNLGFYKCDVCGNKLFSQLALKVHKLKHKTGEEKLFCGECGKFYAHRYLLRNHKREQHPKEFLPCTQARCGEMLKNKNILRKHLKRKHGIGTMYVCHHCGMRFAENHHFNNHLDTHKDKQWKCKICGLMFGREPSLKMHMDRKHNQGSREGHVCSVCGKSFLSKDGLKYHYASEHQSESEWQYECDRCQKRFYRKLLLNMHLKTCGESAGNNVTMGSPRKKSKLRSTEEEQEEMEDNCFAEDDKHKPETVSGDLDRMSMEQWTIAQAQPTQSSSIQLSQEMQYQYSLPAQGMSFENIPSYN